MSETISKGSTLWIKHEMDTSVGSAYDQIDNNWANWSGKWAIVATPGGAALASGSMVKISTGVFHSRVTSANSNALPEGNLIIAFQIDNATAGFSDEFTDRLIVQANNIT